MVGEKKEEDAVKLANAKAAANKSMGTCTDSSDPDEAVYIPPDSVTKNSISLPSSSGGTASMPLQAVHAGGDANISIREYIYFMPYPLPPGTPIPYTPGLPDTNPLRLPPTPFEPTSTLVLTSPNRTFVDIRLFKPLRGGEETHLPNKGEQERLEWCFAGESASQPISPPSSHAHAHAEKDQAWQPATHSQWTHWLDSRFPVASPDIPIDQGDMYPIARNLTLEHGHAFHPLLNAVKTHEEMWRDEPARSTNALGTKICVVLRCHADFAQVRGVVVRVGQFCQGIVMKGDQVTAERWEFEFGDCDVGGGGGGGGEWRGRKRTGLLEEKCKGRGFVLALCGYFSS